MGMEFLMPTVDVEYMREIGTFESGSFDYVPEDSIGAEISCGLPFVNANAESDSIIEKYKILIGRKLDIDLCLEMSITDAQKQELMRLKNMGYKSFVERDSVYIPVGEKDKVVENFDEFVKAVTFVFKKFNYLVESNSTKVGRIK